MNLDAWAFPIQCWWAGKPWSRGYWVHVGRQKKLWCVSGGCQMVTAVVDTLLQKNVSKGRHVLPFPWTSSWLCSPLEGVAHLEDGSSPWLHLLWSHSSEVGLLSDSKHSRQQSKPIFTGPLLGDLTPNPIPLYYNQISNKDNNKAITPLIPI